MQPIRVLVCGSTFAQFYLQALCRAPQRYEIAGILARGSERSQVLAERFGVPLYSDLEQLPDDISLACVVLRSGVLGGHGSHLAHALLARGINVLQEQPLHQNEVAASLRIAREHGVHFHVADNYLQMDSVRRFMAAARAILQEQDGIALDAACANQVLFPLLHMLISMLPDCRPWSLERISRDDRQPVQILQGYLGRVPLTVRAWHQVDPDDPDNHLPLLQRLALDVPGGCLSMQDTLGSVSWAPRLYIPAAVKERFDFTDRSAAPLQEESVLSLSPMPVPSLREQLMQSAPASIGREIERFVVSWDDSAARKRASQLLLTTCQLWHEATSALGYPSTVAHQEYQYLPQTVLETAVASVDDDDVQDNPPATATATAHQLQRALTSVQPVVDGITLAQTQHFVRKLDRVVLLSMLHALQATGGLETAQTSLTTSQLLDGLGVAERQRALIERWLDILFQRGLLQRIGAVWRSAERVNEADLQPLWQDVHQAWQGLGSPIFIDYLRINCEQLVPLMREEQQATLLLFPEGKMTIANAMYRENITARYLNALIAALVQQWVSERPSLRIVEIGAGSGATTDVVIARLEAEQLACARYHFSDLSTFFLDKARQRFSHLPWVTYSVLDIDHPLLEQGMEEGSMDVMICAGVLNNAYDTDATLRHLVPLLAPGGWLLFSDAIREHYEILASQAFMMPPLHDDRQRTRTRFFSRTQWCDALWRAGLRDIQVLPDERSALAPLGQRLFIARKPV